MEGPREPMMLFGEQTAVRGNNFYAMADAFSHLTPQCDYDTQLKNQFFSKSNVIDINGVVINQTYYSHMVAVSPVKDHNILIPLAGVHQGVFRGRPVKALGEQGFFIPANDRFEFETSLNQISGSLIIKYDIERLNRVLGAMTGGVLNAVTEDSVREMALRVGRIDFKRQLFALMQQIDAMGCDVDLLKLAGVDDQFYRLLAMMVRPHYFVSHEAAQQEIKKARNSSVMTLFERYVQTHIDQPIYLSELEAVLGIGARALQLACQKKHGCSPKQYIRQCKLQLAYTQLLNSSEPIKIAHLAAELGFSSQSLFSRYFKESFGLLPSEVNKG